MAPGKTQRSGIAKRNAISEAEVRAALEKVVSSPSFQRSPQMQRFLSFVVEESLTGRGDRLKEYVIGTEVFGRPADYEPQLDSLVRVEAFRLRSLVREYYQSEGAGDSIVVELNKGSYAPMFQRRVPAEPSASSADPPHNRPLWRRVPAAMAITLILVSAGVWLYRHERQGPLPPGVTPTIAVLPFDNLSEISGNEYFCFGLMDEITTDLAKTGQLRVVARTSAALFKRGDDIATIGRQLKADAVLEGSVQRSANRVRVTAQLVKTADSLHLWSETYDRPSSDLFGVQDEIAHAVARAADLHLTGKTGMASHRIQYSADAEANRLFWMGMYLRSPMGKTGWRTDLKKSTDYLEQAVHRDQQFASAYSALSDVYISLGWERGGGQVTRERMTEARRASQRALQLDGSLAEAHAVLGMIQFFYDYDPASAEKEFQLALQMEPSNGMARMWYAQMLAVQRRWDEALTQGRRARELDPLSYMATTHLAVVTYMARRNEETMRLARETLAVADTAPAHGILGMAYEVNRDYPDAIAQYEAALRLVPNHAYIKAMLGHAYAMSGNAEEARLILKNANVSFEQGGLSDVRIAFIYMGLGDRENVFRHLERDYEERDPDLPYINADPVFDPVREDPRFVAILRAMGLAK